MRPLHGARRGEDGIERVGLAAIGDLAAGADGLEDLEILVGDPAALLEVVRAQHLELFFQPADAGAQHDAPAGELIQRHQHARQQHGITIGHDQRGGADAHALGGADQHAHGGNRLHERIGEAGREVALGAVGIFRRERDRKRHVVGEPDRTRSRRPRRAGRVAGSSADRRVRRRCRRPTRSCPSSPCPTPLAVPSDARAGPGASLRIFEARATPQSRASARRAAYLLGVSGWLPAPPRARPAPARP